MTKSHEHRSQTPSNQPSMDGRDANQGSHTQNTTLYDNDRPPDLYSRDSDSDDNTNCHPKPSPPSSPAQHVLLPGSTGRPTSKRTISQSAVDPLPRGDTDLPPELTPRWDSDSNDDDSPPMARISTKLRNVQTGSPPPQTHGNRSTKMHPQEECAIPQHPARKNHYISSSTHTATTLLPHNNAHNTIPVATS